MYLTCSYTRILMGQYFRKTFGHHGLVWFGIATQLGALIGCIYNFSSNKYFSII